MKRIRILRVVLNKSCKTTVAWPLTTHHINHTSKTNKTCRTRQENQGQSYMSRSLMDSDMWAYHCWPISKNYLHQLCVDTGFCFDKQAEEMDGRGGL